MATVAFDFICLERLVLESPALNVRDGGGGINKSNTYNGITVSYGGQPACLSIVRRKTIWWRMPPSYKMESRCSFSGSASLSFREGSVYVSDLVNLSGFHIVFGTAGFVQGKLILFL